MKRVACTLLLVVLAVGCGSSRPSARSTLTTPLPAFGGPDIAAQKQSFEQVVRADPRNKFGWYDLGVIAQSEHDLRTAAADYAKAFTIDPQFESALYNYGLLRYDAADYPTAVRYLRRAVAANHLDANALWYLGLALRMPHTAASDREAARDLNAALKLNPGLARTLVHDTGSGGSGPG